MIDPDINEIEALQELVRSDGWQVLVSHFEAEHGPVAQVQQIDAALAGVGRGDREAAEDTVIQVRARARAAQQLIDWPAGRIKALKAQAQPKGVLAGLGMRRI